MITKGKKYLITGGTGVVGYSLCKRILSLGGHVVVISRSESKLKKLKVKLFKNIIIFIQDLVIGNCHVFKKKVFNWTYGPIIFEKNNSSDIFSALNDLLISEKAVPNAWSHPIYSGEPKVMEKKLFFLWKIFQRKDIIFIKILIKTVVEKILNDLKKGVGKLSK